MADIEGPDISVETAELQRVEILEVSNAAVTFVPPQVFGANGETTLRH